MLHPSCCAILLTESQINAGKDTEVFSWKVLLCHLVTKTKNIPARCLKREVFVPPGSQNPATVRPLGTAGSCTLLKFTEDLIGSLEGVKVSGVGVTGC